MTICAECKHHQAWGAHFQVHYCVAYATPAKERVDPITGDTVKDGPFLALCWKHNEGDCPKFEPRVSLWQRIRAWRRSA